MNTFTYSFPMLESWVFNCSGSDDHFFLQIDPSPHPLPQWRSSHIHILTIILSILHLRSIPEADWSHNPCCGSALHVIGACMGRGPLSTSLPCIMVSSKSYTAFHLSIQRAHYRFVSSDVQPNLPISRWRPP